MERRILTSVKKTLGIAESDTSFDTDIVIHINSAFSTLWQLGAGPEAGFQIEDDTVEWEALYGDDPRFNLIQTYVYLSVRLVFDPPPTSFAIAAAERQLQEMAWRINMVHEGDLVPESEEV